MIPDHLTDTVLFSALLPPRYPELWRNLASVLDVRRVSYRLLSGTRDIWVRDYLPVQIGPGEFVRFRYNPNYLHGHDHLVTGPEIAGNVPEIRTLYDSGIVLDGGNVVASRDTVLVTDRLYRENPAIPRAALRAELGRVLGARVVIIPPEPGDVIGHADGIVRFLDDQTVAINDYSKIDPAYGQCLDRSLRRAGLRAEPLPYSPTDEEFDGIPSAAGNYVNFLRIAGLAVVPTYDLPQDGPACRAVERLLPGTEVVPVRCENLARDGGVLNCVAWTLRTADLPPEPPACDDRIEPSLTDTHSDHSSSVWYPRSELGRGTQPRATASCSVLRPRLRPPHPSATGWRSGRVLPGPRHPLPPFPFRGDILVPGCGAERHCRTDTVRQSPDRSPVQGGYRQTGLRELRGHPDMERLPVAARGRPAEGCCSTGDRAGYAGRTAVVSLGSIDLG